MESWIDRCTHWVYFIFLEFGQGWTYIPCVAPLFGQIVFVDCDYSFSSFRKEGNVCMIVYH